MYTKKAASDFDYLQAELTRYDIDFDFLFAENRLQIFIPSSGAPKIDIITDGSSSKGEQLYEIGYWGEGHIRGWDGPTCIKVRTTYDIKDFLEEAKAFYCNHTSTKVVNKTLDFCELFNTEEMV